MSRASLTVLLALTAGPALAQTPAPLRSVDAPQAAAPATVMPQKTPAPLPSVSRPAPIDVPAAGAPSSIDDLLDQTTDVEPDEAPPTPAADLGLSSDQFDMRIRGASAAAQVLQGPMDGAWSLRGADGGDLYTFQFVDSARPDAELEGAWRDLRRGEGLSGTGLIAQVRRTGNLLQATFYPKGGAQAASVSLVQGAGGDWNGDLVEDGVTTPVRMVRSEPMLAVAPSRYAGGDVVSPYRSPAANRVAPPSTAKGKAVKGKSTKKKAVAKKGGSKKAPAKKTAAKKTTAKKKR